MYVALFQDQILATQLRRLNREATPTISEVYHERNIGLGLAPPLSQLLLPTADNEVIDCKDAGRDNSKQWLSTAALQRFYNDANESDVKQGGSSPCSELSRRDEGDGRSIASQCSAGSYKRGTTLRPPPSTTRTYDQESQVLEFIEDIGEEPPSQPVPRVRAMHPPPPPIPISRTATKLHAPSECQWSDHLYKLHW